MHRAKHRFMKNKTLIKIFKRIDAINRAIGHGVAWFTLVMVLFMAFNVVQRYVFDANHIWQTEFNRFLHAIIFLTAAGYTLLQNEHVRVDVFYQKKTKRQKAWIDLVGTIIFLFPAIIAIACFASDFIITSWGLLEASPEYQGMPGIFILKTFIWVFCAVLMLQGVSTICRSVLTIKGKRYTTPPLDEVHRVL